MILPRTVFRAATAVAAAVAATAMPASATPAPKALALRAADFPGRAIATRITDLSGVVQVYSAAFNFEVGGREEELTELVFAARSPTGATSQYATYAQTAQDVRGGSPLRLPPYGDEQTANWASYTVPGGARRARGELVVRENRVVWTLTIEDCGTVSPVGCFSDTAPPEITKTQAVAELKRYAPMLKARVGSG